MSEEIRTFFCQITVQKKSGFLSGLFGIVVRCVTWASKLKAVCYSVGMRAWLIGRTRHLCSCPNATRDDLLSRSLWADWPFLNFRWPFYNRVWIESALKIFWGEISWLVEKKDLSNYKYTVTFQLNGCVEPTCAAKWFICFGFGHRLDNIRLLKCTFVVSYSIYCFCLWSSWRCISKTEGISSV